jgi:hypothetical protein
MGYTFLPNIYVTVTSAFSIVLLIFQNNFRKYVSLSRTFLNHTVSIWLFLEISLHYFLDSTRKILFTVSKIRD